MNYAFSRDAEHDLSDIYRYTYDQFGIAQADAYFHALEQHFNAISQYPDMGTDFSRIRHHVRRSFAKVTRFTTSKKISAFSFCVCFIKAVTQRAG